MTNSSSRSGYRAQRPLHCNTGGGCGRRNRAKKKEREQMGKEKLIKSKERVKKHAEVFTPAHIVDAINDLCEPELSSIKSRLLEPACGEGAFLKDVLRRRLKNCQTPFDCLVAVSNIYGVDIQGDNVCKCRWGLYDILLGKFKELGVEDDLELNKVALRIITGNIVLGDTINHPGGVQFTMYEPLMDGAGFKYGEITLAEMIKEEK